MFLIKIIILVDFELLYSIYIKFMKYNGELKNIDTQEKAYLLGFLFGDGTVSHYITKNKSKYDTKISINKNDENLILDFKKHFPFFYVNEFDYQNSF